MLQCRVFPHFVKGCISWTWFWTVTITLSHLAVRKSYSVLLHLACGSNCPRTQEQTCVHKQLNRIQKMHMNLSKCVKITLPLKWPVHCCCTIQSIHSWKSLRCGGSNNFAAVLCSPQFLEATLINGFWHHQRIIDSLFSSYFQFKGIKQKLCFCTDEAPQIETT